MIYPYFYLFSGLALGILLNHFYNFNLPIVIVSFTLILAFFLRGVFGFAFLVFASFLAGISISFKQSIDLTKDPVFVECISISVPTSYLGVSKFICKVVNSDENELIGRKVIVYTENKDVFLLSRVGFIGKIKQDQGDMKAYPVKGFIRVDNSDNFLYSIKEFKDRLINNYRKNSIDDKTFSLGVGLVFGDRGKMSQESYQKFVQSGLAHILAISGSHIAILVSVLIFLLFFLPQNFRYGLITTILPFYAVFTGLSIPVVRASLMGMLFSISKMSYLKFNGLNVLFFVGYIYLFLFPDSLFSASFELSFMAMLGIILGMSMFKNKNHFLAIIGTSYIATVFTMPIVMFHFGNLSLNSIISTPVACLILYPYIALSLFNILTLFDFEPTVRSMDFFGNLILFTVDMFEKIPLYFIGFKPSVFLIILFYMGIMYVVFSDFKLPLKIIKMSVVSLIFLYFSVQKNSDFTIYSFKSFKYPVLILVSQDRCYLVSDYPVYNQLNIFNKEGCNFRYLITKKLENFNDDYIDLFDDVKSFSYEFITEDFLIKRWLEYRVYRNSKEYIIKNQDDVIYTR